MGDSTCHETTEDTHILWSTAASDEDHLKNPSASRQFSILKIQVTERYVNVFHIFHTDKASGQLVDGL